MSYTGKYEQNQVDPTSQLEADEGCPFCGAEKLEQVDYSKEVTIFNCWTKIALGQTNRGQMCYERQIEHLQVLLRECWEFFYAFENFEDNMTIPFHIWPSEMLKKIQKLKLKEKP